MKFWVSLVGYQLVWFCAVIGAGRGLALPGVLAMLLYATWQLTVSQQHKADLLLLVTAIALGCVLDGGLLRAGLLRYAAAWPLATMAPAWILALWATFALTFTQSLKYLQTRLWLALFLGVIGCPLAYLGAARGWHAVTFAQPTWHVVLWLAISWGLATPLLAWLARRWSRAAAPVPVPLRGQTS